MEDTEKIPAEGALNKLVVEKETTKELSVIEDSLKQPAIDEATQMDHNQVHYANIARQVEEHENNFALLAAFMREEFKNERDETSKNIIDGWAGIYADIKKVFAAISSSVDKQVAAIYAHIDKHFAATEANTDKKIAQEVAQRQLDREADRKKLVSLEERVAILEAQPHT